MKLEEITKIAELMSKNDLAELAIESPDVKISMKRGAIGTHVVTVAAPAPAAAPAAPAPAPAAPAVEAPAAAKKAETINSPIVGTFYSSPSPDAPAFVKAGTKVKEDTVVCIVEAMKVMNEIRAERSGVIKKVLVENGKPVEYGQPLFEIE
jgi:acetyl-CoA carboxylase biotin carboxyl carrier protein